MRTDIPTNTPTERTDSAPAPLSADVGSDGAADVNAAREARRAYMREIAKRPRGPRKTVRQGSPAWMRRLMDEVDGLREHAMLKRYERELRAELKAANLDASEAIIRIAVRQRTLMEMVDAAAFNEAGGPVHRRRRQLHAYMQQRDDLVAGWLQLRLKLGLDAETVTRPMTFSDQFRALIEEEDSPTGAEELRQARERASAHYAEDRKRHEAEMQAFAQRAIREAFEKAGVPMPVEPAALLTGPLPSPPLHEEPWEPWEPVATDERGVALLSAEMQGVSDAMEREMSEADAQRATVSEPSREGSVSVPGSLTESPALELEPETSPQRHGDVTLVEDMGNVRTPVIPAAPAPPREPVRSTYIDPIRVGRFDGNGEFLPSPWSLNR